MTQQNAPTKCATCGSREREVRNCVVENCGESHLDKTPFSSTHRKVVCSDCWHREPAAPPEGEPVQCLECGHAKESHFSAGSVQEVRYDDPPPSCHVCGTTTMRAFHCNLCGANTWPTNASPPAGMATAEQLPWDEEDEQLLATSNGNVDLIAHLRGEVERLREKVRRIDYKLIEAAEKDWKAKGRVGQFHGHVAEFIRAALESTPPQEEE